MDTCHCIYVVGLAQQFANCHGHELIVNIVNIANAMKWFLHTSDRTQHMQHCDIVSSSCYIQNGNILHNLVGLFSQGGSLCQTNCETYISVLIVYVQLHV